MPKRIEQSPRPLPNTSMEREPCFYSSYSAIPPRALKPHFYECDPIRAAETLAYVFTLLSELSGGIDLSVYTKAYVEGPHGTKTPERLGTVSPKGYFQELEAFVNHMTVELNSPCIPSVSGTFEVCVQSPQIRTERPLSGFVVPMADLEIISTGSTKADLQRDLDRVSTRLAEYKFSGFLLRSGDIGRGGYFYMADFALPYNPGFWETLGYLMTILVDPDCSGQETQQNVSRSQSLGQELLEARSLEQARGIADKILKAFPSIPAGITRAGLFLDPRWVGHKLEAGINCLIRTTPAKGYKDPPQLVGEIF